jgi:DNA-binding CsgD family transcriptional regulator
MLRLDRIKAAIDDVMAAAVLGEGWEQALDRFSHASGAHGAVLMRNRAHHMMAAITTEEVAEAVRAFAAGRAPPNSRYSRVKYGRTVGFRVDHDDYTDADLARDPFYQEFLRPVGYFWHANLALAIDREELVELSLKRRIEAGPYDRADAVMLDALIPDLLVAARFAKYTLDAEARGMARLLEQRGAPVFELDSWGRVLSRRAVVEADGASPLRVVGRRLVTTDPAAQPALDRGVARVLAAPGATALVPLTGPQDRRCFLQILAVPGRARDIFLSAAALAVLIEGDPAPRLRLDASTVAQAFALTDREAAVTCLLAEGATIADVAQRLGMQIGTARVHLRSVFAKTGTNRQAELVALLGRLRP